MRYSRASKSFFLFIITALLAVLMALMPLVQDIEEDIGLSWLFQIRGLRTAPPEVVVISIDKTSSKHYKLPNLARKWPRTLHVKLLNQLKQAGAQVVAFDVHFKSPRSGNQDKQLARAIEDAGNVILFSFLQKEIIEATDQHGKPMRLVLDELVPPLAQFEKAALALAPNPLPKVPVKVSQFWKFIPEAGDAPTLPIVAVQVYLLGHLPEFIGMLAQAGEPLALPSVSELSKQGRLVKFMRSLRERFIARPKLAGLVKEQIQPRKNSKHLMSLLSLYSGEASQFLSYYGPARSIQTIPFHRVAEAKQTIRELKGKLVFVGFSEHRQWEQQDGFYSVYSNEEGLDISGVEITATAAANLLQGVAVKPLPLVSQLLLLCLFAALLALLFVRMRGAWLPFTVILAAIAWLLVSAGLFASTGVWVPLVLPILLQTPIVILLGMTWNFLEISRERKHIQRAFGYYLPETEVNRLARDMAELERGSELMHGICLSTDAQQYTTLSEQLEPQQLSGFMNDYYEAIFKPVREHHGIISDVVGDSVMALWASPVEDKMHREHACDAAIDILQSVEHFNRRHLEITLPTRVGLHYGAMALGSVGAVDHYEYRAVGDIVNTTSRIEGMNKYLGTRMLASDEVITGLSGFEVRYVGRFMLKGKTVPVRLFELCGQNEEHMQEHQGLNEAFAVALEHFEQGRWDEAISGFEQILQDFPEDGPSRFYLQLCQEYKQNPPENWNGVVRMEDK